MNAEIVAVGTELTTGAMLDTNSQWLSIELAALGIPVSFHTTVADDETAMADVLRTAFARSDVVLITGGLGPTLDDLTRQAMARALGTELVLDPSSLEFIRAIFARHNREMPERNTIQAYFPAGTAPISNPRGTAPGIWADVPRPAGRGACRVAAMPGVPNEMKRMFHHEIVPRLPAGDRVIRRARINCFGVGESMAEEMLGDLTARGRDPEVGITVHEATITLRIVAHGASPADCEAKIASTGCLIRERMGELVFGEEDEQLEDVVARLLDERELAVVSVEIGTAGLLTSRIGHPKGSRRCCRGGLVVPSSTAAAEVISTSRADADSAQNPLMSIAGTFRERLHADFALTIDEFPSYDPEDSSREAPKTQIGLLWQGGQRLVDYTFLGDPALNQSRAVKVALNLLRLHLLRSDAKRQQ